MTSKICIKCKQEKLIELFNRDRSRKDSYHPYCKICSKNEKYIEEHREDARIRTRLWNMNNKDKRIAYLNRDEVKERRKTYMKEYRKNHKERKRELSKKYELERQASDINYKLTVSIRKRLSSAIKYGIKHGSAVRDLGCSIEEFKTYLESKFQPGMTWDNWSRTGWHIDHIKPLCSFDLTNEEQFKQAIHYTNLQPLWAKDNLRKGGRNV